MEKTLKKLLFFLLAFFVVACNKDLSYGQDKILSNERVWERQMYDAMSSTTRTKSIGDSLTLINYKEIFSITSLDELEEAMSLMFADDSYIAIQNFNDFSFVILPIGEVKNSDKENLQELISGISDEVSYALSDGAELRLLELEWVYNDITYISRALVDDENGIFFETIGYFITYDKISVLDNNMNMISRMKTRSESGSSAAVSSSENPFIRIYEKLNFWENTVADCQIYCQSLFDSNGIFTGVNSELTYNAKRGYSIAVNVQRVSGEEFKTKHHTFAWGYAVKNGTGASLSWNGVSMTFSGGSEGASGIVTHTAAGN